MDLNLFRWPPWPSQRKVLESHSRHIMVGGPVGPGKTTGVIWKMIWLMINFPRNFGVFGRWVEEHIWDTSIPSIKELYPPEEYGHIMRWIGGDKEPEGLEVAARHPDDPNVLSWDYKSVVKFVPLSITKRLPGGQYGFAVVEQAEQCPDARVWTDLTRRMRLKRIPYVNQHMLGTCNYEANFDWINELFVEKKIENRPLPPEEAQNFEFIEASGEETDKNFGEKYRKEQMALLPPLQAKTLIQGINVRTIGRVYKTWDEEIHVKPFEFADVAEERGGLTWIVSYDYGMDPDPTVLGFIAVDRQGRLWVRAEHVKNDLTVKDTTDGEPGHETLAKDIAARIGFNLEAAAFPAGWDIFGKKHTRGTIADEWSDEFGWTPADCDVASGLERVIWLLSTRPKKVESPEEDDLPLIIVHPECEMTRYGFANYKYANDGSGKPMKKQVPGIKDTMDMIRMAAKEAVNPRPVAKPKSSVLTAESAREIQRLNRRGSREGYWLPVDGVMDPAVEAALQASKRRRS